MLLPVKIFGNVGMKEFIKRLGEREAAFGKIVKLTDF